MLPDEIRGKNVLHVTGEECAIVNAVCSGIDLGIVDCLFHVLDSDYFGSLVGDKLRDGAGAGIEVIDCLVSGQSRKILRNRIKSLGLLAIGLVERLRSNFEFESSHCLPNCIGTFIKDALLVGNGIVQFGIDNIIQRHDFRESL